MLIIASLICSLAWAHFSSRSLGQTVAPRARLGFNLSAQVLPDALRDGLKYFNDLGIELLSRLAFDLAPAGGDGLRRAIGPVGGHGIEGVGDGEYSRPQRNLLALQTPGIAAAVIAFLMGIHDIGRFVQEGNLAQHLVSQLGMLLHDRLLFGTQTSRVFAG